MLNLLLKMVSLVELQTGKKISRQALFKEPKKVETATFTVTLMLWNLNISLWNVVLKL